MNAHSTFLHNLAWTYSPQLRGPITDDVCRMLPGVTETLTGSLVVHVAQRLSEDLPHTVAMFEPTLVPTHAASMLLPALWLALVGAELDARHSTPPRPPPSRPAPSTELRQLKAPSHDMYEHIVGRYLHPTKFSVISNACIPSGTDGSLRAWTGWAMLSAITLAAQSETLPCPGRTRPRFPWNRANARKAGAAYGFATSLTLGIALTAIDAPC
jgi:hypothetical protein